MNQRLVRLQAAESKIRPVTRTTLSDEIVDQIMGLIEKGDLRPGQRLPSERELCVRFGTGRSSLREALRCLSIIGVLHARVGEGTSVALDNGKFLGKLVQWRMTTERHDIENLMEVRIALEGLTAASVARNSTPDEIRQLKSVIERMKTALDDQKRFLELDVEFHLTMATASGNSLALDLITMVRGQLAKTLNRTLQLPNARPLTLEEHIEIMRRIEARDPDGARITMYKHLQAALDRYRKSEARLARPSAAKRIPKTLGSRRRRDGPAHNSNRRESAQEISLKQTLR